MKAEEKKQKGEAQAALLDSVPRALPALVEAQQLTTRAAHVGFDWDDAEPVLEKLHEELAEFETARRRVVARWIEDELGDLLFVLVNLARFVKVDPEQALRLSNAKFRDASATSSSGWRRRAGRCTELRSRNWNPSGRRRKG